MTDTSKSEPDIKAETDQLLRYAAERVLEMAKERAKEVLESAAGDAKDVLAKAKSSTSNGGRWHIGKEVPLAVIGAFVIQTVLVIISYTQLTSTVKTVVDTQLEFKAVQYTREDARRDRELVDLKIEAQQVTARELERRINGIEARLERTAPRS